MPSTKTNPSTAPSTPVLTDEEKRAQLAALAAELGVTVREPGKGRKRTEAIEDIEQLTWMRDNARPAKSRCLCGCGELTQGRFAPGHDAKAKAGLIATIRSEDATTEAVQLATDALAAFGWEMPVAKDEAEEDAS